MRFGTFHLIGSPDLAPGQRRIDETIEQLVLADQLGFGMAWVAEHHFSNYGYSVNPLLLIAKASGLTTRIRFGQAVIVTPFWHPLRLAEDIALTDILTGGRLELGLGRGYQPMEFECLNLDPSESRSMFLEQLEIMRQAWTMDDFTFNGRHFQVPRPTTVLPRPIQQPSPPIWVACQSVETLDWVASQGYGALWSATLMTNEQVLEWRDRFSAGRVAAGYPHSPEQVPIAVQRFVYVTETETEAREAVWQTRWQRRVAGHLRQDDARIEGGRNQERPMPDELSDSEWWDKLVYGTPERCIEMFRRDADLGFSDLIGWFDVGGIAQDKVLSSMRLFAREVLPALSELRVG